MGLIGILCEGEDWIQLAQDKVQWRDFVSTELNFRVQFSDYQFLKEDPAQWS
jgi:hypothetical protein